MNWIGVLALLLPNAVYDLQQKKIFLHWTLFCGLAAVSWNGYRGDSLLTVLFGLLPGCILLITAFLKPESVGIGDGVVICALGLWLGFGNTVWILTIACLFMLIVTVPALVRGKISRKTALPMMPFLLAAAIVYGIVCSVSGV